MLTATEFAGFAGAGLAGAAYVPQLSHMMGARCSAGISRLAFEAWLLASLLTTVRAIAIHAGVFIVLGGIQIVATALIVFCAIRYKDTPCPVHLPRQPTAKTATGTGTSGNEPGPDVRPAADAIRTSPPLRGEALRLSADHLTDDNPRPSFRASEWHTCSSHRYKGQEVMTSGKNLGRSGGRARRLGSGSARLRILLALPAAAAAAAALVACSSAGATSSSPTDSSSPATAAAGTVKTATIGGVTVLTDSKGFTLYSFAPDTPTMSKCNGTCAQNWPPVVGPVSGAGVTGTFGTIKRSDGSVQATFDGHPLYTFAGDTAPGQNKGNGLNAAGGLWHEVTASGRAPAGNTSSSGGGYGY